MSEAKKTDEVKQYLVLTDICVQSDTKVIRGETLDDKDHTLWLPQENFVASGGSFIRAGSVIEKPESLAKQMLKLGVYANAGDTRHFNLESVFDKQVDFMQVEGKPSKAVTLADVLRSHSIHTLEMVIDNGTGYKPLTSGKKGGGAIKAQDVLRLYAKNEDEVQAWLELAKTMLAP